MGDKDKLGWRGLLGKIVEEEKVHKQLELALNVSPITIDRWVSGESKPRLKSVRELLTVPFLDSDFKRILAYEYKLENAIEIQDQHDKEIPAVLYDTVLRELARGTETLRTWGIIDLCLTDMAARLEAKKYRAHYIVSQCEFVQHKIVLKERYILSSTSQLLQEIWSDSYLEDNYMPYIAIRAGHGILRHDLQVTNQVRKEEIRSSVALPLLRGGVAGCLVVCSDDDSYAITFYRYFEMYSALLSLAFSDKHFFSLSDV